MCLGEKREGENIQEKDEKKTNNHKQINNSNGTIADLK